MCGTADTRSPRRPAAPKTVCTKARSSSAGIEVSWRIGPKLTGQKSATSSRRLRSLHPPDPPKPSPRRRSNLRLCCITTMNACTYSLLCRSCVSAALSLSFLQLCRSSTTCMIGGPRKVAISGSGSNPSPCPGFVNNRAGGKFVTLPSRLSVVRASYQLSAALHRPPRQQQQAKK